MIIFEKISLPAEKMEEIIKEYDRIFNDVLDQYGKRLIAYYGSKNRFSAKETADIVSEKVAMLTKIRFEHELTRIYDPYETDQCLIRRQEDLIYNMLYATESFLSLRRSNKLNIEKY